MKKQEKDKLNKEVHKIVFKSKNSKIPDYVKNPDKVLEYILSLGFCYYVGIFNELPKEYLVVCFSKVLPDNFFHGYASTKNEAICKAAISLFRDIAD